jgi:hypothetical protein
MKQIQSHINSSEDFRERIESLAELDQKLETLEVEIETDQNVELLKRIIERASLSTLSNYFSKSFKSPITKLMFQLMKTIDEILTVRI